MSNIKREIELVLHLIDKLDPNVKNGGEKQNVSMTVEDGCKAACLLSTVLESVESIYCTPAPKVEDDDDGVDQLINEDQIVDEDE
ncbi:hypothetical protein [Bathymodiolus japonicus methanotrophic gill symbiont]|uniref:hypothetical protein n=1 Tax=Bathymodiolus japonicus methanotrophic gill symbiont TaxID=113269 RepID=UPI001C8E9F6F|nr:hypothetical protein [Bathymodiolus japonicus methanotrophic gill symbiont]